MAVISPAISVIGFDFGLFGLSNIHTYKVNCIDNGKFKQCKSLTRLSYSIPVLPKPPEPRSVSGNS